jgi:hypothetical protein
MKNLLEGIRLESVELTGADGSGGLRQKSKPSSAMVGVLSFERYLK